MDETFVIKNTSTAKKHNRDHRFTFIDLFAGIGGFRIALEQNGGKCLGFSEIDKEAVATYVENHIHDDKQELHLGDITKIKTLPKVDVLVGGVPCQSWSVAGKMRGFEDPRGKLWMDTIRLVEISRPKAFIFENVKGLADPRNKENLILIKESFEKLGYEVKYKVLNSFDFGVPQNRDRIYIVGLNKNNTYSRSLEFPKPINFSAALHHFFDGIQAGNNLDISIEPALIHGTKIPKGRGRFKEADKLNDFFVFCDTRNGHTTIHSWDIIKTTEREKKICQTILSNRRKKIYGEQDGNPMSLNDLLTLLPDLKKQELEQLATKKILRIDKDGKYEFVNSKNSAGINGIYRIYLPNAKVFSTLTATGTKDMIATVQITGRNPQEYKRNFIEKIFKPGNYRSINPREAARLQGFPEKFKLHQKPAAALKQFGNAVSVPAVYNVMQAILETGILD